MASGDQMKLSAIVKHTHKTLREEAVMIGADLAWEQHCLKSDRLVAYSNAMQNLAMHWAENYIQEPLNCRVNWVHRVCQDYFENGGILYQRDRERTICTILNQSFNIFNREGNEHDFRRKLNLLDVGSCYNPFKQFECYNVTAVDLAPANENVYKCDFLKIQISIKAENINNQNTLTQFTANTFDIVVFSLLLEYLPTPELRLRCCENAYDLLKSEGLLIIITPDSKHVGANAKLMKSWRFVLAKLGFNRFKYEKLKYIHCMAFRKSVESNIAKRWANIYGGKIAYDKMYIPQDVINANTKQ